MYKSKKPYHYGTGRRKSSVARVHLFPNGTGAITINGRDIDDYFGLETLKLIVRQPLDTTDLLGKVDIVRHRLRRRGHRPGRRHPPRHQPRPAGDERRVSPRSEGRRVPDPRPQNEGEKEVRPESRPSCASVLQALRLPYPEALSFRTVLLFCRDFLSQGAGCAILFSSIQKKKEGDNMKHHGETFSLANGVAIPCLGFGTWQMKEGPETVAAIQKALELGYRHIDTAAYYQNERSVGQAVRASGLPREAVFVTSKVWNTDRGYESTLRAFDRTMEKLGLDYLDLYLIHWPAAANRFDNWEDINGQTWRAMTELYQQGRVRAIGVSNFLPHHLEPLLKTEVAPMVNQVECNPGCQQKQTLAYCRDHGILVEAWSPLGSGRVLENATLQALGKQYGKSAAQICLRWCLEQGVLPLPKSVTPQRIQENTAIFDFALTPEDMARIAALPPFGGSGHDPDQIAF